MKKKVACVISFFLCFKITAQTASCCSMPASESFALLGKDKTFKDSHLAPLAFDYKSEKGKLISFPCEDKKDATAFELKADKETKNYLLVIHEWWGLNDYIKQEAEKLQLDLVNVNVIALDLYDGKVATNADEAGKFMSEAKEERIKAILTGAIAYAGKEARIQTIGWCFGGGWSLQAALLAANKASACVMYYGMPEKDVEKLKALSAPVLGLFAGQDNWITKSIVAEFEKNMHTAKKEITVKFFDAQHAFANPSNPKFNKAASEEADRMAIDFLKKQLK